MKKKLNWMRNGNTLLLQGELSLNALIPLWNSRREIVKGITHIDLSGLSKIDTAGVALLIHFVALGKKNNGINITISHVSKSTSLLIRLYNLTSDVFPQQL